MKPNANPNPAELRTFGLLMSAMIMLFFGLLIPWIWGLARPWIPWAIAAIFAVWALAAPASLGPIYRGWTRIGAVLGWINTRVILGFAFFCLILPIGLALRAFGKDPLSRAFDREASSYRQQKKERANDHMERPY